jgi:hypothetical protein
LSAYLVNSLTDTGAGSGLAGDLRYCVAHATSGADTINFGVTGTIKLESALPALNTSVAIAGPGAGALTVERDAAIFTSYGIFTVGSAATVQVSGLTLTNANTGAITNAGKLTISDSVLSGNSNSYWAGGAGAGGAIYNSGALTIRTSTLSGNGAYSGGAIENVGGWLTISDSTLSGNTASGGYGGAIDGGSVDIRYSTLCGNSAVGTNAEYLTNEAAGGAIYGAAVTLVNSTIAGNTAVGGWYYTGDYPYYPYYAYIGANAYGGAIAGSSASIDHCTFGGNAAIGGDGAPGDPGSHPGFGFGNDIANDDLPGAVQLRNTIIGNVYGTVTSLGNNLVSGSGTANGFGASDLFTGNPQLGPLQNNGGPTQTMALLAGSPAINAGDSSGAPAFDQRGSGFARVVGGTIDIGAFEVQNIGGLLVSGMSTATAGVAASFTVTAKNADGSTNTGYTGSVHFISSDPQAVLPADYTFTAADGGTHTFAVTFKTAGVRSITATDTQTASETGRDAGIIVNAAAASTFTLVGFPSAVLAGQAGTFTITAWDAFGNMATGYTGTVHFTSSDPYAVLPANYTFTAADQGAHTFTASFRTGGTQSISATDTQMPSLTGTEGGIAVNPAASLTVAGFPSAVTAGGAGTFTVSIRDAFGNLLTAYTGTAHFTSRDPQAVLPADYTFTAADAGTHTFSATLKTAGTQPITAHDPTLSPLFGSQLGIVVSPAAAARFLLSAPATVAQGAAFSLTLTVQDAYGNVVTGYVGTVHFTSSDNRATLPASYTFTAADAGVHTFLNAAILRKRGKPTLTVTDTLNGALTATDSIYVV